MLRITWTETLAAILPYAAGGYFVHYRASCANHIFSPISMLILIFLAFQMDGKDRILCSFGSMAQAAWENKIKRWSWQQQTFLKQTRKLLKRLTSHITDGNWAYEIHEHMQSIKGYHVLSLVSCSAYMNLYIQCAMDDLKFINNF